ncbi:MAG: hypothetical protein JWN08_2873 [Frankiales bacterium]|jgi:hypothetical protein|nr:hypothetical protein [Frankiales bacterium]
MSRPSGAVVPSAPLLVPALAGGSAHLDADLREAVDTAVCQLVDWSESIVVVGCAARTGAYTGTWDWSGFGVQQRGPDGARLPLSLGIGAWLLDQLPTQLPRSFFGVREDETAEACRLLGEAIGQEPGTGLLIVADGSARRDVKAPGHLDSRAEPFDREVGDALREGSPERLLALSVEDARELLAQGRAPWQVMAGAFDGPARASVSYDAAPYGVGYFVSSWAGS